MKRYFGNDIEHVYFLKVSYFRNSLALVNLLKASRLELLHTYQCDQTAI